MHFIDSLFTVINQDKVPTGANFKLCLNANHPIYHGHFPDNPITPGVCSLEIMMQLTAINYSGFKRPSEVSSIKYLGFVNPLVSPKIDVELKMSQTGQGTWRVRGTLSAGGKPAVKMIATYQNDVSNPKN